MKTKYIRKMIRNAVEDDHRTGALAMAVRNLAMMRGVQLQPEQEKEVCSVIQEYIEHAPVLIEQVGAAAQQAGVSDQIEPLLNAAGEYFSAPFDVIPDQMGLVGLVDDAYVTHTLLQGASESVRSRTGQPLLQADYAPVNLFIRGMIGEPQASMLDTAVATTLHGPILQQILGGLVAGGLSFSPPGPDPIWGNATMDEIVNARLGPKGVV